MEEPGSSTMSTEGGGKPAGIYRLFFLSLPTSVTFLPVCSPSEHNGSVFLAAADEVGASMSRQIS